MITHPKKRPFASTIIFVSRILRTRCLGLFFIVCVTAASLMLSSVQSFSLSNSLQPHGLQPGFPVHHQILKLAQTHAHQVSDIIQPSHPLSSPSLPAFNLAQHQGLSKESVLRIRWPKYWSLSFNISLSNEYSGLISFRLDWLDLLAVRGLSRGFCNTTVQQHQFFSAQLSL